VVSLRLPAWDWRPRRAIHNNSNYQMKVYNAAGIVYNRGYYAKPRNAVLDKRPHRYDYFEPTGQVERVDGCDGTGGPRGDC